MFDVRVGGTFIAGPNAGKPKKNATQEEKEPTAPKKKTVCIVAVGLASRRGAYFLSIKIIFNPGAGVRSDADQIKELKRIAPRGKPKKTTGPTVKALKREGVLSVGGVKVKPEALKQALGDLGYELKKKVNA